MVKVIEGDRVGRRGRLAVGCSAAVFDDAHERVLLIRRADNGHWDVPGGYMEPGESLSEACAQEVLEETGLQVIVKRLIAAYTNPDRLLEYEDGNRWQLVVLHFEAQAVGGELKAGDEARELAYYAPSEIPTRNMYPLARMRAMDAFEPSCGALVRDRF